MTANQPMWIFSMRVPRDGVWRRQAVVGPASSSTVEAALHLAGASEEVRAEVRASAIVRDFVEGKLDPDGYGHHVHGDDAWYATIGSVHVVLAGDAR